MENHHTDQSQTQEKPKDSTTATHETHANQLSENKHQETSESK